MGKHRKENCWTILKIDLRYALVIGCMEIRNYLMNGWNINEKGLEKKIGVDIMKIEIFTLLYFFQ